MTVFWYFLLKRFFSSFLRNSEVCYVIISSLKMTRSQIGQMQTGLKCIILQTITYFSNSYICFFFA